MTVAPVKGSQLTRRRGPIRSASLIGVHAVTSGNGAKVWRVTRLRHTLLMLCGLAAVWAAMVSLTGGFAIELGRLRLSSRNPANPILIALICGVAALVAGAHGGWRRQVREDGRWLGARLANLQRRRWPDPIVLAVLFAIGVQVLQWVVARPLWLDEEMLALNIRERPWPQLAGVLWLDQSAPLGWLMLQRSVMLALGTGEHALRLVSLLFAIATSITAAWVGRRWAGRVGGALLVVLCAIGPWLSWYQLEFKHYSADILWGLLLPALAVWTAEAPENDGSGRASSRALLWWAIATIGQWFANGALLVVPACALVLLVVRWRRGGIRSALVFSACGLMWLASFALQYAVSLRYTLNSEFLSGYWAFAMPPQSAGVAGTLAWIGAQFEPFAAKPGGTAAWLMFWIAAFAGFAFSRPSLLGVEMAVVPVSAFLLAALHLVPLHERLSLWVVPSLYLGIAVFVDGIVRLGSEGLARRRWMHAVLAAGLLAAVVPLGADLLRHGREAIDTQLTVSPRSNHALDDRAAVAWLMQQRRRGDALAATHFALPAVWWYGRTAIGDPASGGRQPDGSAILEVRYLPDPSACAPDRLREALKGHRRVLMYFGFRFDDVPKGFDGLALDRLGGFGAITMYREFADVGGAAVIDLAAAPVADRLGPADAVPRLDGCISLEPAARW